MLPYGIDIGNPALEEKVEETITVTTRHYMERVYTECALRDEVAKLTEEIHALQSVHSGAA